MTAKHTPGPWRVAENSNIGNSVEGDSGKRAYEMDDGFRTVALYQACCASDLWGEQQGNALANGRLIAAAPELLAALKDMVAAYEAYRMRNGEDADSSDSISDARAVIKKAEG